MSPTTLCSLDVMVLHVVQIVMFWQLCDSCCYNCAVYRQ